MEKISDQIGAVWQVFRQPTPWALLLVGVALLYWANLLSEWQGAPNYVDSYVRPIADTVHDFGKVLLGASFASFIWKYLKFRKQVQEVVAEVFFSDDFLGRQTTPWLQQHLRRTGVAFQKKKFPEIAEDVLKTFIDNYTYSDPSAEKVEAYHKTSDRLYTVDWEDKAQLIVRICCEMTTVMVASSSGTTFPLEFSSSVIKGNTDSFEPSIRFDYLKIDGTEVDIAKETTSSRTEKARTTEVRVAFKGTASEGCRIELRTERVFRLSADPLIVCKSKRFTLNPTIEIQCIPDDLTVTLLPLGTPLNFEPATPTKPHPNRKNDIYYSYQGLVFPGQGFVLALSLG